MKRADELFTFEELSSTSPFVDQAWRTRSEPEDLFISVAVTNWEMVVARQEATTWLTIRGPETGASLAPIPQDAEFFGIQFSLGTYMPGLDMRRLVDGSVDLPAVSGTSFWLDGSAWELPGPDNADVFVDRLVRAGLLTHDPVVAAAVHEDLDGGPEASPDGGVARQGVGGAGAGAGGLSTRSVERRVARATGLTRGAIRQIRRAHQAVELLSRGVTPLEVVRRAGYADQPHLTRSLKRFAGQTPSQIVAAP